MNIFLIQPGLSEAIVRSQTIKIVSRLNIEKNQNYIMLPFLDERIYKNDNNIIFYKNYLNTLRKIDEDINYIYTRSFVVFIKLFLFRFLRKNKFKILIDFRGLASAESFARNKSIIKFKIYELIELFAYKNADSVHSVSFFLKDWLTSKWGTRDVNVVPCCVDKIILKEKNNIDNEIKFVYVGSTSFWQKIESTIRLYKTIESKVENSSLTIITKEKKAVTQLLKDNGVRKFKVKSLLQEEVLSDLVSYDFGFLLRDNILMNNVASPVKFIEYISRGVIPILSSGIGDYSSLVIKKKIGIIVKNNEIDINQINFYYNDNDILNRLYKCSSKFTWDSHLKTFLLKF